MRNYRRVFGALLILALAGVTIWLPTGPLWPAGQDAMRSAAGRAGMAVPAPQNRADDTQVSVPVTPYLTEALRDLPIAQREYWLDREVNPRLHFGADLDESYNPELGPDPLLAVQEEAAAPHAPDGFETLLLNFSGQGYTAVNPPDTIGDVGPNHYIQMINHGSGSSVTAYDKNTGAVIFGPVALSSLAPTAHPCRTGAGDPIVLHDQLANRWLLSEFSSSGNYLCVYISQTANPGDTYYFYPFQAPNFPDYPKYAVWPDAYYVSTNETGGPAAYALDRTRMLAGLSATYQRRTAPRLTGFGFQALTPADLDGSTPPPAGTPGLFMRHRDTEVHGPSGMPSNDLLELWAFTVNWTTPASSTFSKIADIQVTEFDSALCGLTSFECIPQPGTSTRLDPLREVIMWRLSYRNFGNRQVLVGNFSVDVGSDRAGVRWFELRRTSGNWFLHQEGTYAPGNISRWMGAIAMDREGNMALGYNVGSSSTFPGLRYVGRLAGDGMGAMPRGEYTIVNGTASNGSNRYGDYSAMSVDPSDGCTFWFTGQWNNASTWSTRIAKFKFDQCGQSGAPPKAYLPVVLRSTPPVTLTHSQSQAIASNNSVACVNSAGLHSDNAYLREFNLTSFGISGSFAVSEVQFGVESAQAGSGGTQPAQVRLYRKTNPAGPLTYANLTLLGTANATIVNQTRSLQAVPVTGTAPAGSVLVVEVFTPNGQAAGHRFFIGSNAAGQTGPSYIAAAGCGFSQPTNIASIGYPNMHIVMNVTGRMATGQSSGVLQETGQGEAPVITLSSEVASGENQLRTLDGSQSR